MVANCVFTFIIAAYLQSEDNPHRKSDTIICYLHNYSTRFESAMALRQVLSYDIISHTKRPSTFVRNTIRHHRSSLYALQQEDSYDITIYSSDLLL